MIDYKKLLDDYGLWPVGRWQHLDLIHTATKSEVSSATLEMLEAKVTKSANGIYVYRRNQEWLYVGKGKPLVNRMKSHYREAYEKVPGDTKTHRWHRFFSQEQWQTARLLDKSR
jgi:hypothetical protein